MNAGLSAQLTAECGAVVLDLALTGATVELWSVVGGSATAAISDVSIKRWSRQEFDLGEGPAMQSQRQGRPVLVGDLLQSDARSWPAYALAALEAGMRAVHALPLQVGATRLGVLVLFSEQVRHLDTDDLRRALRAADGCTRLLVDFMGAGVGSSSGTAPGDPRAKSIGSLAALIDGVDLRSEVYQAQGMTMALLGVGLPEALARLRAHAFVTGRSLDDVATDVVERRLVLPADPGRPRRPGLPDSPDSPDFPDPPAA